MKKEENYRMTYIACYLGFITQAIASNFAPLLFLKFHSDYGISLGQIAVFPAVFYFTQLVVDVFCAKFVDRIGYRVSIVASEILSALGLIALAFLPELLPSRFAGILLSVILYAVGSGLIEVLCSPIIEACPSDNKSASMSLLHSIYCLGVVGTILISTLLFRIFGIDNWKWVACIWAIVPLCGIFCFSVCPINRLVEEGEGMSIRGLCKTPVFWISIVLMICAGASELSMAQWASAFVESAIGLPKAYCDLLGPCLFAVTMGLSRLFYGKSGEKINLSYFMLGSGILCLVCYLTASLFKNPVVALIGCILCGSSVGIMWPGTLSISSEKIPSGGTALFALLAMAGDLGGSLGPGFVGLVSQSAGDSLKAGMLAGGIFPVVLIISILIMNSAAKKKQSENNLK